MSQMQQIKDKCHAVYAIVQRLYGLDLTDVRISFNLRGRAAGKAGGKGFRMPASTYFMKFNHDMLSREAFDHLLNDTVPHEIAHIVCFMRPELGKNHDHGWARVCRSLGGTGQRTHKEDVVFGKGVTYEYTTTNGHKVRVSQRMHARMQLGAEFQYRKGLGRVNKNCAHQIVGISGRTLEEPVRKVEATIPTPPNAAPVIESWTRERVEAWKARMGAQGVVGTVIGGFTLRERAPATAPAAAPAPAFNRGESKASIARAIMLSGHRQGQDYETIIAAIMQATGHDRQLARATYKANAAKVGIPL